MGISHEEQLLNELLREVREADERLDAVDLEARVVRQFTSMVRLKPEPTTYRRGTYYLASAAVMAAATVVLVSLIPPPPAPLPVVAPPNHSMAAMNTPVELPAGLPAIKPPTVERHVDRPSIAEPVEFVPLMPFTERELTGPFQIVRVQMPRASLGALTSPFEHPNEVVEADVLLGEDGMAQAIRVSTKSSLYPRRLR